MSKPGPDDLENVLKRMVFDIPRLSERQKAKIRRYYKAIPLEPEDHTGKEYQVFIKMLDRWTNYCKYLERNGWLVAAIEDVVKPLPEYKAARKHMRFLQQKAKTQKKSGKRKSYEAT